jgi:hypothetical protein
MSVIRAERRIWFIVDGDDLYMDINENGDLTDPAEKLHRLELSHETRREVNNYSQWRIPDIRGQNDEPIITDIQIKKTENSAPPGTMVVWFSAPGRRHVKLNPLFSHKPADAPVLHVTGPYQLRLTVRRSHLSADQSFKNDFHVDGHLYVDGLGRGTRFVLESSNLDCRIEFPRIDGTTEVKEMRLQSYNTGPYQTATASLPKEVDDGRMVRITLSTHRPRRPGVAPAVIERRPADLRAERIQK